MEITVTYLACGCVAWVAGDGAPQIPSDPHVKFQCPRCRKFGMEVVARETRTVEAVA